MSIIKRSHVAAALAVAAFTGLAIAADAPSNIPADYKGTPFEDEMYKGGAQKIPGTVFCAYYDKGGEGVAFHYGPKTNLGSNGLNKGGKKYVDLFRREEAVSTSYTKDFADKWEGQKAFPAMDMLYLGWTEPGEWVNLTVDVAEEGTYTIDLLYTSNKGGALSLDLNGKKVVEEMKIETTNDPADKTDWRQWHHWNLAKGIAEIKLPAGKNLLTLHVEKEGNMNLGTMEFKIKK